MIFFFQLHNIDIGFFRINIIYTINNFISKLFLYQSYHAAHLRFFIALLDLEHLGLGLSPGPGTSLTCLTNLMGLTLLTFIEIIIYIVY